MISKEELFSLLPSCYWTNWQRNYVLQDSINWGHWCLWKYHSIFVVKLKIFVILSNWFAFDLFVYKSVCLSAKLSVTASRFGFNRSTETTYSFKYNLAKVIKKKNINDLAHPIEFYKYGISSVRQTFNSEIMWQFFITSTIQLLRHIR